MDRSLEDVSRRTLTLWVTAALAVALAVVVAVLPVPYVVLQPGPTYNTLGSVSGTQLIEITGTKTYDTSGHLNLTTVAEQGDLDLVRALRGWWDGSDAVVPRAVIYPPGQSDKQVQQQGTQEMQQSQDAATVVALRALGVQGTVTPTVASIEAGTPAAGVLRVGDEILSVDGQPVNSPAALVQAVRSHQPGESVQLTIRRDGATKTVTVQTQPAPDNPSQPQIGFSVGQKTDFPFQVKIHLDNVGGPSAGLMFALGIYDKLTPTDLTGGTFVAGTGTLDDQGDVGPIGGIRQKLAAAAQKGAKVFLVPAGNCSEALQDPPQGVTLARVTDFQSALNVLQGVRNGTTSYPTCSAAA